MTQAIVNKSEELMDEDREKNKRGNEMSEQSQERASGSGLTEEQRREGIEEVKRNEESGKDESMGVDKPVDSDFGPHGHEAPRTPKRRASGTHEAIEVPMTPQEDKDAEDAVMQGESVQLEEAPRAREDIRVPLASREPAQKRERNGESPARQSKWQAFEKTESQDDGPADSVSEQPSPVVRKSEICKGDLQWKNIGSGTMARTFKDAKKLMVTTRGGPPSCDVHRRIVRNLNTGRVIDDCIVDDTPDEVLFRDMEFETDIRVELILKDALETFSRKGADVVEIYSQPRITQEAAVRRYGKTELVPGWSLDLTRNDPKTGEPWDLSDKKVQSRVDKMIRSCEPMFVIG